MKKWLITLAASSVLLSNPTGIAATSKETSSKKTTVNDGIQFKNQVSWKLWFTDSGVVKGDMLGIGVEAKSDMDIQQIHVKLRNVIGEDYSTSLSRLSPDSETFDGSIDTSVLAKGKWKVVSITVEFSNQEEMTITEGVEENSFFVETRITPLEQKVYTTNQFVSNKTFSDDIYVGPNAVLSMSNVTVYGDIYVLGAMMSYGNLSVYGKIHANSFRFGRSELYQGGVVLLGQNTFYGMEASQNPLKSDVPFELYDTPLIAEDGKIQIAGSTLPIVTVLLENQPLSIGQDGTFRIRDYEVGAKRQVTFTFRDIFGNKWSKSYKIMDRSKPEVTASLESGVYLGDQEIKLEATKEASIHYTTDGSMPNAESWRYGTGVPLKGKMHLRYIAVDELGITSETQDKTYYTFTIDSHIRNEQIMTGTGVPGMTVVLVKNGEQLAKTTVDQDGTYKMTFDRQPVNANLTVLASIDGFTSRPADIKVTDTTEPGITVSKEMTDQTLMLTGTSEANAVVQVMECTKEEQLLGNGKVKTDGTFEVAFKRPEGDQLCVVATDENGNSSQASLTLKDVTAPVIHKISELVDSQTSFSVTAEGGNSLIEVLKNGKRISSKTTNASRTIETYQLTTGKQKAGTKLNFTITDPSGNKSKVYEVIVKDKTLPVVPTISTISDQTTLITGKGEALAQLQVLNGKRKIGQTQIKSDGTFSVKIAKVTAGTSLSLFAIDRAGNQSKMKVVRVVDKTVPVFTGIGAKTIKYKATFQPLVGVTAKDNVDGVLTKKIKVTGQVNTKRKGTYVLVYTVSDKASNKATVKRKITVK